ncbi:hypothetical protein OpiT1DRAFT_00705 [Opitutaceae bacterium TAV1]|nr:hypothetical protein OpiT1DRAFT_00705 [Opitutaceae bacterium TAV1]
MKKILTALLALAMAGALHAQTITKSNTASLFGQRYVSADAEYYDIDGLNSVYGGALGFNLPITTDLDALFRYSYSWEDGHTSREVQTAEAGLNTWFDVAPNLRAFAGADLGYTWGDAVSKDDWYGRLRAGAEYTIGSSISLLAYAAWSDGLDKHIPSLWSGTGQASYWFTRDLAATARISWLEGGDLAYSLGALFKF